MELLLKSHLRSYLDLDRDPIWVSTAILLESHLRAYREVICSLGRAYSVSWRAGTLEYIALLLDVELED